MQRVAARTAALAVFCGLSLLMAGCGSSREYAIPEGVCGVPVGEKELSALLPDGEKLDVTGTSIVTKSGSNCDVSVDDFPAVSLTVEQVDKFYDPMSKQESFRFTNRKKMAPLPFDGAGAMGDKNVMISTSCGLPEADHLVVLLIARDRSGKDVDTHRSDMEAFVVDLVPQVKTAMGCPGSS
ncbi:MULTISPECIES: hypothetical protein [unclassified Streptomyces]|uniref:hypothetical protein n=1 Tax=unclassified Streptomyces TaxID=2593676 RepID=UPI00081DC76F|nr:hypothetical protein [Streptomyces sp. ScaeMP-e83]SCD77873.1 hypothetical protein GA0115243_104224 [Streptomyces sp. ScaeMP-e83]